VRTAFREELDLITASVAGMTELVGLAMDRATVALLDADLALADQVMVGDRRIDALRTDLEDRCVALIAQQQPVATDLRLLISTIHLAGDLERMGDLAHHVAKIARLRHPRPAVPAQARDVIARMGDVARSLTTTVADVLEGRDVALATAMETDDDAMDALRRTLFTIVLSSAWPHGTAAAIDATLLGRYYERYADHAVAIGRRTVFVATGTHP
jgi:phosphate transport system protein